MLLQYKPSGNSHSFTINLPGSKSISNRYLILNALAPTPAAIVGLSKSRDTRLLQKALQQNTGDYWFEDGATPLRFFLAYAGLKGKTGILDGTIGLCSRTIAPLVQALEGAGARFHFPEKPGYPPVSLVTKAKPCSHLVVDRSASSQFVSAILLIAPGLSEKFHLQLTGNPNSDPYIQMTLKCMANYGIVHKYQPESNAIALDSGAFQSPETLTIEPDWSSASYFYSLCACLPNSTFHLPNLQLSGMQGDEHLAALYRPFGVTTKRTPQGIQIQQEENPLQTMEFDLSNHIDLAPAIICSAAFLNVPAVFRGLENLRLKESDRLQALNHNLNVFGCGIRQNGSAWRLEYFAPPTAVSPAPIHTFGDHRIAMAFSLFTLQRPLEIDDGNCVVKSFPDYWNELTKCNFVVQNFGT